MKYNLITWLKLVDNGFYTNYDELADHLYAPEDVKLLKSEGYIIKGNSHIILTEKGIECLNEIKKK